MGGENKLIAPLVGLGMLLGFVFSIEFFIYEGPQVLAVPRCPACALLCWGVRASGGSNSKRNARTPGGGPLRAAAVVPVVLMEGGWGQR